MSIDPRMLSVQEWCEFTTPLLISRAAVPRLLDPQEWQQWALTILQSPKIAQFNPPDPRIFKDWREWAFRFNQAVPI